MSNWIDDIRMQEGTFDERVEAYLTMIRELNMKFCHSLFTVDNDRYLPNYQLERKVPTVVHSTSVNKRPEGSSFSDESEYIRLDTECFISWWYCGDFMRRVQFLFDYRERFILFHEFFPDSLPADLYIKKKSDRYTFLNITDNTYRNTIKRIKEIIIEVWTLDMCDEYDTVIMPKDKRDELRWYRIGCPDKWWGGYISKPENQYWRFLYEANGDLKPEIANNLDKYLK